MDRNTVLEFLKMVITAFVIAFVINIVRITVFDNSDFLSLFTFSREEQLRDQIYQNQNRRQRQNTQTNERVSQNNPELNNHNSDNIIEIPLEQPICFNNYTKNQVLELRQQAIKTSPIFSDMGYQPNSRVFQIVDNLPWISLKGALHFNKIPVSQRTAGESRESVGILNPELIYYVSTSENEDIESSDFKALYKDFYFIPYRVTYNPATKTITTYTKGKTKNGDYQPIFLSDSNAHDLGYNYAFMDNSQNVGIYSDEKYSNNSLKSNIQQTTGYYMRGSACGIESGCNNYAPYWQYYNHIYLKKIPARFNIKLWKNRPTDSSQPADLNYTMVFQSEG